MLLFNISFIDIIVVVMGSANGDTNHVTLLPLLVMTISLVLLSIAMITVVLVVIVMRMDKMTLNME